MLYTVYFGDKPVFICDQIPENLKEYLHHPDTVSIDENTTQAMNSLMHEIQKKDFHAGIACHEDIETLWKHFRKHFLVIQASGGIVENETGEILMIHRRGKWDLPKGKLDKGETLEMAAIREVQEETGLSQLRITEKKGITYHTYDEFGKHILKESHWYHMQGTKKDALIPQVSEDIMQIEWVQKDKLSSFMPDSYPSIREILLSCDYVR
jgi:8-oxo-dGTP pyrophosphatase MutT (NUDIX family)